MKGLVDFMGRNLEETVPWVSLSKIERDNAETCQNIGYSRYRFSLSTVQVPQETPTNEFFLTGNPGIGT
jgi:hypothetical protein